MPDETNLLATVLSVVETYTRNGRKVEHNSHLVDDLGLDSMAIVSIFLNLESRLNLKLTASDMTFDELRTPETIASILSKKLST